MERSVGLVLKELTVRKPIDKKMASYTVGTRMAGETGRTQHSCESLCLRAQAALKVVKQVVGQPGNTGQPHRDFRPLN